MPTNTNLLNVDGEVMLPVPVAILEQLDLGIGSPVELSVDRGRLIIKPDAAGRRPSYTFEELLAQCELTAPLSESDPTWLTGEPQGRELL